MNFYKQRNQIQDFFFFFGGGGGEGDWSQKDRGRWGGGCKNVKLQTRAITEFMYKKYSFCFFLVCVLRRGLVTGGMNMRAAIFCIHYTLP